MALASQLTDAHRASCNVVPCGWMAGCESRIGWAGGRMIGSAFGGPAHSPTWQGGSAHGTFRCSFSGIRSGFEESIFPIFPEHLEHLDQSTIATLWTWDPVVYYGFGPTHQRYEASTCDHSKRTSERWSSQGTLIYFLMLFACQSLWKDMSWTFTRQQVGNEQSLEELLANPVAVSWHEDQTSRRRMEKTRLEMCGDTRTVIEKSLTSYLQISTGHWTSWIFFNVTYAANPSDQMWSNVIKSWSSHDQVMIKSWSSHAALRLQRPVVFLPWRRQLKSKTKGLGLRGTSAW